MSTRLTAVVEGIGFVAPGIADWNAAREILADRAAYQPAPTVLTAPAALPPAERRRASRLVKAALGVGLEAVNAAGADASTLATVFSSSSGDGHNCHALCETLASSDRQVSPTRFHNSVHNAAAGYWGIATGAMAPSQVLCAYDASFGAGLLEAMVQVRCSNAPVLLIAYDAEYPEPIHAARRVPDAAGVALLLVPEASERSLAELRVELADRPVTTLQQGSLESLRSSIPAMRSLPMLQLVASRSVGEVGIEYLPPQVLQVGVVPC